MNKKEFTEEVANRCMVTKYVVDEIFNVSCGLAIEKMLKGEQVEIPKFGKFLIKTRSPRTYKKFFGKDNYTVDGYVYPSFQVSSSIKNRVRNGVNYSKNI